MDPWDLSCRPPRQPAPAATSANHKASIISSQLLATISSSGYSSSSSTSSSSSSSYSSQTSTRSNSLDTTNGDGLLPLLAPHPHAHHHQATTMTTSTTHALFQVTTAQATHSGQTDLVETATTTMTTTLTPPPLDRKARKKDQNRRAAYNYRRKKMEEKNRLREEEMRLVYSRVCLIGYADELEGTIMYILNTKTRKILDKDGDVVRFLCPLCLQSCDNLMNLRGHLNVMHHFSGADNGTNLLSVVNDDNEDGDRSNNNANNNNDYNNSC